MKASLKEFIQDGSLGSVEIGDNRSTLQMQLGDPQLWHSYAAHSHNADIWKYGDVEFYFQGDSLWMIFMDDFKVPTGGTTIELDPWIISDQLTCAEAEQQRMGSGVSYRKEDFPVCDNGFRLITSVGTVLTFSGEDYASPTLCAIHKEKQTLSQ